LASSKIEDLTIHLADLERLSLPGDATPEALIPLLQLLPPSLAKEYQDPVVLSPRPRRSAKGVHLVTPEVYPLLIDLLAQRRMIAFVDRDEIARDGRGKPVYNGLFCQHMACIVTCMQCRKAKYTNRYFILPI
jgi:hypothetical protein